MKIDVNTLSNNAKFIIVSTAYVSFASDEVVF